MQQAEGRGTMVSVRAGEQEVLASLEGRTDRVAVAAVNGPHSCVLSGDEDAVLELAAEWKERGRRTRQLQVSHAFHSPHMEPVLEEFRQVAATLTFLPAQIPVVSNLTGQRATDEELSSPGYWSAHIRRTVRFLDGIRTLRDQGVTRYLELGPDPVLTAMAQECLAEAEGDGSGSGSGKGTGKGTGKGSGGATLVPLLRARRPEARTALTALAQLHVSGHPVDWPGWFEGPAPRPVELPVELPVYAFQHKSYWLERTSGPAEPGSAAARSGALADAPFWQAVDGADPGGLAELLQLPDEQRQALRAVLPGLKAWRQRETWGYRTSWQHLGEAPAQPLKGTWLVLVREGLVQDRFTEEASEALEKRGARVLRVGVPTDGAMAPEAGADAESGAESGAEAEGARSALAASLAQELGSGAGGISGVLSLLALGADGQPDPSAEGMEGTDTLSFALTSALPAALAAASVRAPVWAVTRGAVQTGENDPVSCPAHAPLWGLGHLLARAHPDTWGGLVDLPPDVDPRVMERTAQLLAEAGGEDQLAVRAAYTAARRLLRTPLAGASGDKDRQPRGAVLVTGTHTATGAHAARRLARQGAGVLLLAGTEPAVSPEVTALREELAALGARTEYAVADPAAEGDRPALAGLLDGALGGARGDGEHADPATDATGAASTGAALTGVALTGVVHVAVPDDASASVAAAGAAVARQTAAVRALEELTRPAALTEFVTLACSADPFGGPVPAALEGLARQRRAAGLPALAVTWGPTEDGTHEAEGAARTRDSPASGAPPPRWPWACSPVPRRRAATRPSPWPPSTGSPSSRGCPPSGSTRCSGRCPRPVPPPRGPRATRRGRRGTRGCAPCCGRRPRPNGCRSSRTRCASTRRPSSA